MSANTVNLITTQQMPPTSCRCFVLLDLIHHLGDLMKLRPLHDRVIVKRIDSETKTASGIVIPDAAAEKPCLLYTSDAADD